MKNLLAERAMLVRLTIRKWSPERVDKGVTDEVALLKGADRNGAGCYRKNLIAKAALKELTKVSGAARTYHYERTLPWLDDGQRILTAKSHMDYYAEMAKLKAEFDRLAGELVANFDSYVTDARATLGAMFNHSEYPEAGELANRFSFEVGIAPIPDSNDFRVSLPESELKRVRADLDSRAEAAMIEATKDMWRRVTESLSHMATTLATEDGKFKNSLVGNVAELAEIMDAMNVAEDPDLAAMGEELREKIAGLDPEALRNDRPTRQATAALAKEIAGRAASKMKGYGGGRKQ